MKSLLHFMSEYKKEAILAPLFKLLEACFDLFVPLVVAAMIDKGILAHSYSRVWTSALTLAGLAALGLAAAFTAQYYAARAATGFVSKIRRALFRHMNRLSYAQLDAFGADSLATRMTSDANQVQTGVNLVLRLFMRSPMIVFGATVMAFFVDVKSGFVFLIALPVLAAIVFGIMLASIPVYKKAQGELDSLARSTRENLSGARVIRAFRLEERERESFAGKNARFARTQQFAGALSGLTNPATYVVANLALVALISTDAVRVDAGALTQGQTVALLNYMAQILVELVKLANLIVQTNKAVACGDRIAEVLNAPPEEETGTLSAPDAFAAMKDDPALAFRNVSFAYPGTSAPALSEISFEIPPGATVGVLGGTGSGKTTLLNLIPRFYEPTSGTVELFGRNAREYELSGLRGLFGIAPQQAEVFKGSVGSNLRWGNAGASDAELLRALEIAQIRDFVDSKAEGLDYEVAQSGRNLSGGQRQRVTIARALLRGGAFLILDDSSSALDFATDARLRKALRESVPKSTTTFISAQRASSVLDADVILVLDDGRLVGIGTHEELLATNEVYREIYYSQFPKEDGNAYADRANEKGGVR